MPHRLVTVDVIEHEKQRYPTVGDWIINSDGSVNVLVSNLKDKRYNMLVAIHELIEALLCEHDGVDEAAVCAFDIEFESARQPGDESEPGHDPKAPYHFQHRFAEAIEQLLAIQLNVDWRDYSRLVNSL